MESVGHGSDEALTLDLPRQVWAVGGGKGGVGKSLVGISLAFWLGRLKRQVVLVDADLGGANLHTMLGIRLPRVTLEDFLLHRVAGLEDALLETPLPNVRLLAGGGEVPALANPNYGQKTRLLRALNKLTADHILVDLGAGTSLNVLDFFLASRERLVVLTPQPTSIENAYGFIKAALYRKLGAILKPTSLKGLLDGASTEENRPFPRSTEEILEDVRTWAPECEGAFQEALEEFKVKLVVNMARGPKDQRVGDVLREVSQRYLGVQLESLGTIPFDPTLERWATRMDSGTFAQEGNQGALAAAYQIAYGMMKGAGLRGSEGGLKAA